MVLSCVYGSTSVHTFVGKVFIANTPIVAATAANLILKELYKYRDCLDAKRASELFLKNSEEHAINLIPGVDPLYGPLYNLFRKKLKIL